jgi:hypothetical protein
MPRNTVFKYLPLFLLSLAQPRLQAQNPEYHMELRPWGATMITNVLVEDGPKAIEAFSIVLRQGNGTQSETPDYLSFGAGSISLELRLPEHPRGQHNLLAQGDGYQTFVHSAAEMPGNPEVKAIIFSDGSTEGDPMRIMAIQAARDGYSDEVNFWVERLNAEDPAAPKWDALVAEGAAREKIAKAQSQAHKMVVEHDVEVISDPGRAYWLARMEVAMGVSESTVSTYQKRLGFPVMRSHFLAWKEKIDSDQAKALLEATYPLPDAIRLEATKAYTPAGSKQTEP